MSRTILSPAVITLAVSSLALSCRKDEPAATRYRLEGSVVGLNPDADEITIAHQDIPGLMPAMTMPFKVKESWVFDFVEPGDEVHATLVVTAERSWLEDLVVSQKSKGAGSTEAPPPIPGEPEPGHLVPDFALVNQDGAAIHLSQYRGKALVLTFIYTRCPLPEYCPRMTSHFTEIEYALAQEPGLYRKTHLLTISFDPDFDTPTVLKEYAQSWGTHPRGSFEHWTLATGSQEQIRTITEFFGLTYYPEEGQFVHSLRTALIAPDGKLFKLYRGNAWSPTEVLDDLRSMGPE